MPSQREKLTAVLDGAIAYGWPYAGSGPINTDDPWRGYLRRLDDGRIQFELLDEDVFDRGGHERPAAPTALAFSTQHGSGLLADVSPNVGWNTNFGGSLASVLRFTASTMLFDIDLYEVRSAKISMLSTEFEGLDQWAGIEILSSEPIYDDQNLVQGATFGLASVGEPDVGRLDSSVALRLRGRWRTYKAQAITHLVTGLEVEASARRARSPREFGLSMYAVQDLVGLLAGGFVAAVPGRFTLTGINPLSRPAAWLAELMVAPAGAQIAQPDRLARPYLTLNDIGGVSGVARWVRLHGQHPRAVAPLTAPNRMGVTTPEIGLVQLGVAIEYFVASHRRGNAPWAQKSASRSPSQALARQRGVPFDRWIGGSDRWSAAFHATYNALKHDPAANVSEAKTYWLALSGYWLLLGTLLDKVARSKAPSRHLFTDYRLEGIGRETRLVL